MASENYSITFPSVAPDVITAIASIGPYIRPENRRFVVSVLAEAGSPFIKLKVTTSIKLSTFELLVDKAEQDVIDQRLAKEFLESA